MIKNKKLNLLAVFTLTLSLMNINVAAQEDNPVKAESNSIAQKLRVGDL